VKRVICLFLLYFSLISIVRTLSDLQSSSCVCHSALGSNREEVVLLPSSRDYCLEAGRH